MNQVYLVLMTDYAENNDNKMNSFVNPDSLKDELNKNYFRLNQQIKYKLLVDYDNKKIKIYDEYGTKLAHTNPARDLLSRSSKNGDICNGKVFEGIYINDNSIIYVYLFDNGKIYIHDHDYITRGVYKHIGSAEESETGNSDEDNDYIIETKESNEVEEHFSNDTNTVNIPLLMSVSVFVTLIILVYLFVYKKNQSK